MSTDITNYDEMLAQMARRATEVEKPSGSSISVRAGILQYNGAPVQGNKLEVIVLASTHSNLYYDEKFNPNDIKSPVCFAYGEEEDDMLPHAASSKPQAQNCTACPQNQWGSDPEGGRGKACKNTRSLALIPAGTTPEDAATAEVAVLKLPVMTVKNWQMYVQKCAALHNRPPLGMITEVGVVPDAKSQFRLTFTDKGLVARELLGRLIPRIPSATEILHHVYSPNPDPQETPAGKRKGSSKF